MRVSTVTNGNQHLVNNARLNNSAINAKKSFYAKENINFKGMEASAKSLIGTFAGIGLGVLCTAASGGLAAPLLLGMFGCATGGIVGSNSEAAKGNGDEDIDYYI